jgi:hypothetical protein
MRRLEAGPSTPAPRPTYPRRRAGETPVWPLPGTGLRNSCAGSVAPGAPVVTPPPGLHGDCRRSSRPLVPRNSYSGSPARGKAPDDPSGLQIRAVASRYLSFGPAMSRFTWVFGAPEATSRWSVPCRGVGLQLGLQLPEPAATRHTVSGMSPSCRWRGVRWSSSPRSWAGWNDSRMRSSVAPSSNRSARGEGTATRSPVHDQLRGKLRELRFYLGARGDAVRICYYIASQRRIILLTVFTEQRRRERAEIDRAERAMKRCIQDGHTAEEESDV